jgi:hypothetical protein
VASVATPCFFSGAKRPINLQLILTNNRIFKVGYVQPCIAVPIPDV